MIKTHKLFSHMFLLSLVSVSVFGTTIQSFESGTVSPGSTSLALMGCPNPGLTGEGTYSIGGSSSTCHSLWASVGPQAGSNYMIVNGSTSPGMVYQQTVNITLGLNSTFGGYFTGLYLASPATLQLRVFNGTAALGSPAAQLQFVTSVNPPAPSPLWALQTLSFVPTGTQVTVQVYNATGFASGNDFGIDSLDVTQFGAAVISSTPEPASFVLAGTALLALAMRRKV